MAYTKEQMNEIARAHLARRTRLVLGQIELEIIYTSALDLYARVIRTFKHRDTWNGDGVLYYTTLAGDFIASRSMRVGTGPTAQAEEVDQMTWNDHYESALGGLSPNHYIYSIDDEQSRIWVYPAVPNGTEVQHWIWYVPACPAATKSFPNELELHPFLRCLKWALAEMDDKMDLAEALKSEIYMLAPEIQTRCKERSKEPHRRTRVRQLG